MTWGELKEQMEFMDVDNDTNIIVAVDFRSDDLRVVKWGEDYRGNKTIVFVG